MCARFERRWPVALTIALAVALLALLPERIRLVPLWVPYLVAVAALTPVLGAELSRAASERTRPGTGSKACPAGVVLECSAVPDIEHTAFKALTAAEQKFRAAGTELWLAALNPAALKIVERPPLGRALAHKRTFLNLREAVGAYESRGPAPEKA